MKIRASLFTPVLAALTIMAIVGTGIALGRSHDEAPWVRLLGYVPGILRAEEKETFILTGYDAVAAGGDYLRQAMVQPISSTESDTGSDLAMVDLASAPSSDLVVATTSDGASTVQEDASTSVGAIDRDPGPRTPDSGSTSTPEAPSPSDDPVPHPADDPDSLQAVGGLFMGSDTDDDLPSTEERSLELIDEEDDADGSNGSDESGS